MILITNAQREQLFANGRKTLLGVYHDPFPIVKLFTPDANCTWLLTELDCSTPSLGFGLADLGLRSPEMGNFSIAEIQRVRGPLGLKVERDLHFKADKPLSSYAAEARQLGYIRT